MTVWSCWMFETLSKLRWSGLWTWCPSFVSKIKREVKEPTLLSEKSSGSLPGYVIYRIAQVIQIRHGLGGSQYAHKWTDGGCQWQSCMLTSELTVSNVGRKFRLSSHPQHVISFHFKKQPRVYRSILNTRNISYYDKGRKGIRAICSYDKYLMGIYNSVENIWSSG